MTYRIALLTLLAVGCASIPKDEDHPESGVADLTTFANTAGDPPAISIPRVEDKNWALTVAYESDVRINGVACGELDPDTPGDEIVTVDRLGRIRMHRRAGDGFEEIELPRIPVVGGDAAGSAAGELVQVVVGDLAESIPGDEIVAVGMAEGGEDDGGPGAIRVFARSGQGGAWVEYRFVTSALVHAVAIDDFIAERPGLELLAAGFFGEALVGQLDAVGRSVTLSILGGDLKHDGNAKGACATNDGFVLACDDGSLVQYRETGNRLWELAGSRQLRQPLARVAYHAELDRIAVCGNGGGFGLWERSAVRSNGLIKADNRLRGAVIAELDPDFEGLEAATAGYDGQIRVIWLIVDDDPDEPGRKRIRSTNATIARDTAKIHHLTTGHFDGLGDGRSASLVSCGYSGEVLVLSRRE